MIIAHADGNCFYASCERSQNPSLWGVPVIVLSNNDGCTIARSDEAKALGIKMGDPYHIIAPVLRRGGGRAFSANFPLYGDMSARMMSFFGRWARDVEVYSIDEAFLDFTGAPIADFVEYARRMRYEVRKQLILPISVGLGPTKVLAKIANRLAKSRKTGSLAGVYSLLDEEERAKALDTYPVEDIWGIAGASAKKLNAYGIYTASELRDANPDLINRLLHKPGVDVQTELRGIPCKDMELIAPDKKQIISSRSFGRPVFSYQELLEAVAQYTTRAAEKLRKQGSVCGRLTVLIHTNPFKGVPQYYSPPATAHFLTATAATSELVRGAETSLKKIFREGIEYKKAIVILSDISPSRLVQPSLWDSWALHDQATKASQAMDKINRLYGRDTIRIGTCGTDQGWVMRSNMRSPRSTTRWDEIPIAYCS